MQGFKFLVAGVIGLVAAGGGIAAAATTGSSSHRTVSASSGNLPPGMATVNVASASVGGKSEQILVDSQGLPLYTYGGDSPMTSAVTGSLAALWPPLEAATPTESGASGKLTVVQDSNGSQVQYDGHFLYTFVSDSPEHVTGQGVQNFFVATPGATPAPVAAQAKAPSSSSYGSSY